MDACRRVAGARLNRTVVGQQYGASVSGRRAVRKRRGFLILGYTTRLENVLLSRNTRAHDPPPSVQSATGAGWMGVREIRSATVHVYVVYVYLCVCVCVRACVRVSVCGVPFLSSFSRRVFRVRHDRRMRRVHSLHTYR